MRATGRLTIQFGLIAAILAGLSLPVFAASEGGSSEEEAPPASTTTIVSGLSPAVELGGEEAPPPPVDWTYRYMVPTALALAGVIIVVTSVKYFTDVVRKRYRIVEE